MVLIVMLVFSEDWLFTVVVCFGETVDNVGVDVDVYDLVLFVLFVLVVSFSSTILDVFIEVELLSDIGDEEIVDDNVDGISVDVFTIVGVFVIGVVMLEILDETTDCGDVVKLDGLEVKGGGKGVDVTVKGEVNISNNVGVNDELV